MAVDECAICTDPCIRNSVINTELSFRNAVLSLLCDAYPTETEEAAANAVVLPQITKTAAELAAGFTAYANTSLLDASKELKYFRVINDTDADLDFSLDGGATTHFTVRSYSTYEKNLGSFVTSAINSFQMKIATGAAASLGSVKIEGSH